MNTQETAHKFVELCKAGKNFEVMQTMYDDNIVSVEAALRQTGTFETVGKQAVIQKSIEWASGYEIHSGAVEGPFLAHDKFAVIFEFDVTSRATGERTSMREVGVYTVVGGVITREEFLYGNAGSGLAR